MLSSLTFIKIDHSRSNLMIYNYNKNELILGRFISLIATISRKTITIKTKE